MIFVIGRWCFFFFNDTATTEIYTLSLHDALPISQTPSPRVEPASNRAARTSPVAPLSQQLFGAIPLSTKSDRKSTRLNSSHSQISYAVFCLKKKKTGNCLPPDRVRRRRPSAQSAL